MRAQAAGVHVTNLVIPFESDCRILDYLLSGHFSYRSVFTVSFQSDRCYMGEKFPQSLVVHDVIKGLRLWNTVYLNASILN
ncbi:unnamed protein product [Camellia sinensis]